MSTRDPDDVQAPRAGEWPGEVSNDLTFRYKGRAARHYQRLVLETGDPDMMSCAISSGPRLKADDLIGYMIHGAPPGTRRRHRDGPE